MAMHDNNVMRRQARGQAGDIVIIDFDRVMHMTAGYDFGAYLASHDNKPMDNGEKAPYPPLACRLAAAQAYIDAIGPAECAKWSRATPEEVNLFAAFIIMSRLSGGRPFGDHSWCDFGSVQVVYDMEKGSLMRLLWLTGLLRFFGLPWLAPLIVGMIEKCLDKLDRAERDPTLKAAILEHGIAAVSSSTWQMICCCVVKCYICRYRG